MANLALTAALAKALGGGGGGGGGGVEDVLLNGQSIVNAQGAADIPTLGANVNTTANDVGAVAIYNGYRNGWETIEVNGKYYLRPKEAPDWGVQTEKVYDANGFGLITSRNAGSAAFYGLAKAAGASMRDIASPTFGVYPEAQKSAISQMLNAPETVSGSTPSITAKPGVQYICGEVSTIDITVPESGIIDVIFESGSTPAVLTVTPPTGVTVVWPDWFDPTALEANKVYEVNIANGRLATVMVW